MLWIRFLSLGGVSIWVSLLTLAAYVGPWICLQLLGTMLKRSHRAASEAAKTGQLWPD
jgi:hypothetical protein